MKICFREFPGGPQASQVALKVKNSPANAGHSSVIPGSRRSPGEGNGKPLQYSSLGNLMDRGAWGATVHGVAKKWTRLSDFTHTHIDDSML